MRLTELAQRADVPGVAHPEAGVLADDDGHGAERVDEAVRLDELLGRLLRELRVNSSTAPRWTTDASASRRCPSDMTAAAPLG